ncbi:MAG: hypothetical protein JXQ65_10205 [Candidatus Marinimicrobia bacterium]|nr:hypothetical protein [Candidatus Neomarinimicrobiota bacterium]
MKKIVFVTILTLFFIQCNWFESSTKSKKKDTEAVTFLALYLPGGNLSMGNDKLIALIEVKNGKSEFSPLADLYPYNDELVKYVDINNDFLVMGLHRDFNEDKTTRGVWLDIDSGNQTDLPIFRLDSESEYPYFQSNTARISDNGYILYLSATNNRYYGDTYRPYLIRYNPADGTHRVAPSPNSFIVNQPEKGNDTEAGQFGTHTAISPDGRYAYGNIDAFGVSGNIHWDYEILFQYDFENDQYKRLGEEGDADVNFLGMTRDGRYLVYTNGYQKKLYNLQTEEVKEFSIYATNFNPLQSNSNGFCRTTSIGIYYQDLVDDQEIQVIHSNKTSNAHFSEDGSTIYFTMGGSDVNYICKSLDLQENTDWDTLATVSKEFKDFLLVR